MSSRPRRHGVKKWAAYGLTPLPELTPAYLPLGGPHVPLHVLSGELVLESDVRLSKRWFAVEFALSGGTAEGVQVGDVVVARELDQGELWWLALSRVLRIERGEAGVRLTLLVDMTLEFWKESDLASSDPRAFRTLARLTGRPLDEHAKRQIRDLWHLDLWCPACGAEGTSDPDGSAKSQSAGDA